MLFQHPIEDSDSDDERITALQTQIDELRVQLTTNDATPTGVVIIKHPAPPEGLRFRPTELPEYNGNRENYPAWRSVVLLIFQMDWHAFNYTDTRAFLAIYMSLKGDEQTKAGAFFEAGGIDGTRRPEDFLEFLDRSNLDCTRVDKAADQLYGLRMWDTQRWASSYPTWLSKLTEAEGDLWNDRTKTTMLKNALNDRLRHSLRGNHLLTRANFTEWVRIVGHIAQQVEEDDSRRQRGRRHPEGRKEGALRHGQTNGRKYDYANYDITPALQAAVVATGGAGDVVMGGVNTALVRREQGSDGIRRSRWKGPEEISRLRRERRCYRCERKGCNTKVCPLQPAVNPATGRVQANSLALPPIEPTTYEEID
ncbi:hypothetical protein K3495_g2968 [Podosphaera aphanis]|nr:hypothetical protein K3495_g2968 [Podosphaera aphanis]